MANTLREWTYRETAPRPAEKASGEKNIPGSLPSCSKELPLLLGQKSTFDKNQSNHECTGVQVNWTRGSEIRFWLVGRHL